MLHVSTRTLAALSALALTVTAGSLSAQEVRAFSVGAGGAVIAGPKGLPISDDAVTAIVAQHFAETLHSPDAMRITIVVDANGQYVSGSASKAQIFTRTAADMDANGAHVDSTADGKAKVMIRRTGDPSASGSGAVGTVMMTRTPDTGEGGVMGTGVAPENVGTIGMKTFTAGQMGDAPLAIVVVKLK